MTKFVNSKKHLAFPVSKENYSQGKIKLVGLFGEGKRVGSKANAGTGNG